MKRRFKLLAVLMGVTFVVGSYVIGIVLQYVFPSIRTKSGGDLWNVMSAPVSYNPFTCIIYTLTNQTGKLILLILIALVGAVFLFKFFADDKNKNLDDRNFNVSEKGTYGTAGWMSKREALQVLEFKNVRETTGMILGVDMETKETISLPDSSMLNKHVAVFGASGSMKSRGYVRPQIIQSAQKGESVIVTDPKGEMYRDTAEYLRNKGYKVFVFDLIDHVYSDSWACLREIDSDPAQMDIAAQTFCDIVIKNTGGVTGDSFWDNAELNLLKALCLLVITDEYRDEEQKSIGAVYELLTGSTDQQLTNRFTALPIDHPARDPWSIFKKAENLSGQIQIGLGSRMSIFQNRTIKKMTAFREIDLEGPAKEKTAIFVIMPDQDATFNVLSSLFFSFLFIRLVRYADTKSKTGKCDVPVNLILDEFPNIGQIPDFTKKISTVRSRDIRISVIFQNIPQLQNRYPDGLWEEIIGNCDTHLFLGTTDPTTAEYISKRSGEMTIEVEGERIQRQALALTQDVSLYAQNLSAGKRYLLTMDEVLRYPNNQCLIILRGQKVFKAYKFDYEMHPESRKFKVISINQHIPEWRAATEPKADDSDDDYDDMFEKDSDENAEAEEKEKAAKPASVDRKESSSPPKPENPKPVQHTQKSSEKESDLVLDDLEGDSIFDLFGLKDE